MTVTAPPMVPAPPRVAPLDTCTVLAASPSVPFTRSVPPVTWVVPAKLPLSPLRSSAPAPCLTSVPPPVKVLAIVAPVAWSMRSVPAAAVKISPSPKLLAVPASVPAVMPVPPW